MMKELFFQPRGIYYRVNEFQENRPTLVFVHGLSGSSSAWAEYENKFEKNYNVLCFDLRGHGKSAKSGGYEDYKIEKFSQDIRDLTAHLDIKKLILISHSFGTLVALDFLTKYQGMLASSIFLSPGFRVNSAKTAEIIRPIVQLSAKLYDMMPFYSSKIGGHVDYSKYKNTGDWDLRRMFADVKNTTLKIYLFCLGQSYEFNGENFLDKINIPVLLVHGKNDTLFPVENSVIMHERIKNSKLVLLDNTDHIIVLNNFPEVSEAIENFI
ncbi:MAG: alpha/beta hydrolase [Patescibacteria group bacterium]